MTRFYQNLIPSRFGYLIAEKFRSAVAYIDPESRISIDVFETVGAVAQLGERIVRNDKVGSSILPGSTIKTKT